MRKLLCLIAFAWAGLAPAQEKAMHVHLARRAIAAAIAAAFVPALHAQSRPATTTEPVQTLSPVFVTANPLRSGLFDLADPVNLLEGRELLMKRQPTPGFRG